MNKLIDLRGKIEKTDEKIAELLIERFILVKNIGKIKEKNGIPVHHKNRGEELLNNVLKKTKNTIIKGFMKKIFQFIFKQSRKIQK